MMNKRYRIIAVFSPLALYSVLTDATQRDLSVTLCGQKLAAPLVYRSGQATTACCGLAQM